jgi:pyocin large subunit-like protein
MWADNQRYSAQQNADYQFRQHGQELDAADLDGFLVKVHAFVNDPPRGAKTIVRSNGDTLIWDAKSGLFGVVREDGAPRTVFKPDEGEAYWAEQLRENQSGRRTTTARRD